MNAYHVTGALNALFFGFALLGIGHQWLEIRRRRRDGVASPTEVLSLNQLGVSFFAYWAFFVYGYWMKPFNPYLVWPRLAGAALLVPVLFELARDRRDPVTRGAFGSAVVLVAVALQVGILGVTSIGIELGALALYAGIAGRARRMSARPSMPV